MSARATPERMELATQVRVELILQNWESSIMILESLIYMDIIFNQGFSEGF